LGETGCWWQRQRPVPRVQPPDDYSRVRMKGPKVRRLFAGGEWIRNFSSALPPVVSRVSEIRDPGKNSGSHGVRFAAGENLDSTSGLTGFGSKASSLVCRLESLRIPLKACICAKATGSKKAARRREVRLGFGTFDPASAQAGLSPHGRSVVGKVRGAGAGGTVQLDLSLRADYRLPQLYCAVALGKSPLGRNDYVARISLRAGERRLEVMRWGFLAVLGKRHIEKGAKSRTI